MPWRQNKRGATPRTGSPNRSLTLRCPSLSESAGNRKRSGQPIARPARDSASITRSFELTLGDGPKLGSIHRRSAALPRRSSVDRKSVVEGKRVDLGGRRII